MILFYNYILYYISMANPLIHKANKASFGGKKPSNKVYLNEEIKAPNIILVDENGEKLWTMSRYDAFKIAWERNLDVMQVHYDFATMTSACRLVDYGKFQYDKKKTESEKRKNQPKNMKEINFKYNISDNDLEIKIKRSIEFLELWHQVMFIANMRWREVVYRDKMVEKIQNIIQRLENYSKSQWIKKEARKISTLLIPKKK